MANVEWTANDVVKRARRLLQDTAEPYRFPTSDLIDLYNDSLVNAVRIRPDILYNGATDFTSNTSKAPTLAPTGTTEAELLAELEATDLPVHERYVTPLAMYISGFAALSDDEFTVDNRAVTLLRKFEQILTGIA